jgi:hypothetical protein
MRIRTRILSGQHGWCFAPFSRWQEYLRRLCAEQRQAAADIERIYKRRATEKTQSDGQQARYNENPG